MILWPLCGWLGLRLEGDVEGRMSKGSHFGHNEFEYIKMSA